MKPRAALAAALVASFAALAAGCGGGGSSADLSADDVATVGSIHIAKQRYESQLELARASYKAQGRDFPKAGTAEFESIKAQAMALLVQAAARELRAAELGISVTDADVNKSLAEIKKQYFSGDEKKYEAQLAQQGLTDAEVREQIKTQLISQKVSEQVTVELEVSDEEIAEYYAAHADEYQKTERAVRHILFGKNKKALAEEVRAQIAAGADFGPLAKKYSQDPGSKDQGGKFTAVKGEVVPKFGEVTFALKTGELSEPFETPEYGWFIIKAEGPVKDVKTTLKQATDQIRQQLLLEKRNQAMSDWLSNAAQSVCNDGGIAYQVGYTPNPDPCAQFTATTPTVDPAS